MVPERAPETLPHAWLGEFVADPRARLAELLYGRARLGALSSADVADAVRVIFGSVAKDGVERLTFDRTLAEFLMERRKSGADASKSDVLAASNALRLVSLLKFELTAKSLRQDLDLWVSWTEYLSRASVLDVRAELFSAWALTQRIVGPDSFDLEPYWLGICDQAGGSYPKEYLGIALLGLRMLPDRDNAPSERAWMTGLLRWAAARKPTVDEFTFQWRALRHLYPRPNSYWRLAVAATLKAKDSESLAPEIWERWRHDVGLTDELEEGLPPDPLWMSMSPAEEVVQIIQRIERPLAGLGSEIREHIAGRERYARATGNYYFLVASACNIGMRLIERGSIDELTSRAVVATELAKTALRWERDSVYGWALWRDALAASGAVEAAELVGWEAVRRFPENEQWRNQLALLLSDVGKTIESGALLEDTIRRFPRDAVSRNQLAGELLAQGRSRDAIALLEPAISQGFADAPVFLSMARAIHNLDQHAQALSTLDRGLLQFPTDEPLARARELLMSDKEWIAASPRKLMDGNVAGFVIPRAIANSGALRRIAFRINQNYLDEKSLAEALSEVKKELARDPHSDYAKFIGSQLDASYSGGGFVAAFQEAMKNKDPDKIHSLEDLSTGYHRVFDVAKAYLFGDLSAASRTVSWLSSDGFQENRGEVALRRFMSMRFGESASSQTYTFRGESPEQLVRVLAANDNIPLDLLDSAVASVAFQLAA